MLDNKRQFFAERDALKQGLSVVKEDEEKPATEKESIFKGESVYVKMLDQVVDLFEEGDYSEIKLTYLRNAYSQLKKEYNTIKKDDVVKCAKFIASVMKYHFEGNKTFTRNVGGKQLRVTAKSFSKSKLMVFFKILNLSVIILGNKNKSDEELKIVIEGSSKMLNAPKTPQAGRDLYNDLKSKYNVSIPTIDLTNTIEASLGAEVDKSVRDKEIDSVAKELRSSATSNRQGDKKIVDDYQKAINTAFTGSNNLDEVKTDVRKDLLDNNKYKLDKIPKNTMIKVFNKNVRIGTFINNLRASLKKTDTETDTQKKVSLILNDVESKKSNGNLTLKYMKQVQKEINKNFNSLNPKNKFTYDGKRIDKNGVKKVIQAEVDSFGKKERKQRNTIESNLLKVENYVKDDDSVLPEAKTAINLLRKKKQNEKYRFFDEVLTASQLIKVLQELVDDEEPDNMDDKPNSKKKTKIELDFHQKFEILPNTNSDKRDVMYIAGASGSVSRLDEDETLDCIRNKNEDKAVQDLIDQVSSMGRLHHKKKDEDGNNTGQGLERKEISNLKKMGSRWVNIPLKSFIKLRF
eukprot:jgi/Bigna1/66947/fgenesh1_pg.2_\